MAKVRRVPWKNKDEWLEVYDKLHGAIDLIKTGEAAQHMELWIESYNEVGRKTIEVRNKLPFNEELSTTLWLSLSTQLVAECLSRGHCPPAVEYTCRFIQPMSRDPYFFPSQPNPESGTNLQVQYATSILRFINILGEVESEKSLSLNARALKIGLPEWVVNTRHQISHGSCLPSLDLLRISVDSLVKWLKTNYWEVERDAMRDLILPNCVFIFEDKLIQLLNIYVYLHDESSKNTKFVGDITNEDTKREILKLRHLLYQIYRKEIRAWETTLIPPVGSLYESKKLLRTTILNTVSLVIRTIKPYFEHEVTNATKIFVDFLLQDSANKGMCIERWQLLLGALHAKGKFPCLLNIMADHVCNADSENHIHAAEWTIFLLKSLLKRYKAQKKLDLISSNSIPSSKRIKLHLTEKEKALLTKDRVKHQLSVETGSRESDDVLVKLFEVIERKNPSLKATLKLKDAKFLSEQEIHQLIHKIFLTPNNSTQEISELLLNMSNRLNKSAVFCLHELMKLKSNTLIDVPKNNLHVFDSTSLAHCLLPETQAHTFTETVDDFQ